MKSLYRYSIVLLGIVMVGFLLPSCKTTKSSIAKEITLEKSLLWKISGPGVQQPSYLFGTIHLIPSKDYFLPEGTLTAMDEVQKVMFEIDMKELSDMSSLMSLMGKVMMHDNKTLKDLVTEADYTLISEHFKKLGLPLMLFERMKPMFLSVFASGDMDPAGLKNGSMKSYEMEFAEMAKNAGKETGGLETIDFQLSLFDSIPYDAQAKMLVDVIKSNNVTGSDGQYSDMVKMYVSQDINKLIKSIKEESGDVSGFEDKLLIERNKNWIPQMISQAKAQSTFFAVGAGHLGGKDGVIHLLRQAGMKVTPVHK